MCIVGVAYASTIIGVRILGEDVSITDITEAMALSYKSEKVDIYSNSWGPEDGHSYTTFGRVSESALIDGVTLQEMAVKETTATRMATPVIYIQFQ